MIDPELSKVCQEAFREQMDGKVNFSARACMNWIYSDDLNRAVDAAVEAGLRFVQEKGMQ